MTGNTHRLLALLSLAALDQPLQLSHDPVLLIGAGVVAVSVATLPDLDQRLGLPHRTITHALLWSVLLALSQAHPLLTVAAVSLALHILADMLAGRVQALWPLPYWIGVQAVKTGGLSEQIFVLAVGGLFFAVWIGPKFGFSLPVTSP